jgi:hypothetical protein
MPFYGRTEADIRKESASQAIEKTIQAVERALGIEFPRGDTPTESRDIMTQILRGIPQELCEGLLVTAQYSQRSKHGTAY